MKSFLRSINIFEQCGELRAMGLSLWSCPQFVFIVMGVVIIGSILVTYNTARRYAEVETIILILFLLTTFLMVVSYVITHAFERVVVASRRETERAREIIRLKDQFVFVAAHELRTPANTIKWGLELLGDAGRRPTAEDKKILDLIQQSNNRLLLLVGDILEAARLEGQVAQFSLQPVSIGAAWSGALGELQDEAGRRNVQITQNIPSDLPPVVSDPSRLKEVFVNLLSNAIKYGSEERPEVSVRATKERDEAVFSLTNNGPGIKPEDRRHVFEKFWRSGQTPGAEGTGLGLFIVKELVSRMGGRVWFESAPGITTFSVALKIAGGNPNETV